MTEARIGHPGRGATMPDRGTDPGHTPGTGRGSALRKAFAVLEVIAGDTRPVGLAALAERLDMPKQTVHRVVGQLEDEGYLRREPMRDRYVVGPKLNRLAIDTLSHSFQAAPVHNVLTRLVGRIGESCNVGMLNGPTVVYLDRVECDWPLRLQLAAGSRLPIHATAIGKLLLAFLPPRGRRRILTSGTLPRFTDRTLCDPDMLDEACRRIRQQDYAVNDQEQHVGLVGLAVPMRTGDGRVIAGLALHCPLPRMDLARALTHLDDLRGAAGDIAALLEQDPED